MKNWKGFIFLVLLVITLNNSYAQSIGAEPEKTITVKTNTLVVTDFGVSQGASYDEIVIIEGDYDWLTIEEREFILESKSKKSVRVLVNVKKAGTHVAHFRICASPITKEGAVLSTQACASHILTVVATLDNLTKTILILGALVFVGVVVFLVLFFRKRLRNKGIGKVEIGE